MFVARFIAAMDVVSGIPFGHTSTQFCEFPHPEIPPSSIKAASRSSLFIAPVGCALYKRTSERNAGPIKFDLLFTFGHASRHTPHVIHFESSYAHCRRSFRHARTRSEIISSINWNPCFNTFQRVEHSASVHDEDPAQSGRYPSEQDESAAPICPQVLYMIDAVSH